MPRSYHLGPTDSNSDVNRSTVGRGIWSDMRIMSARTDGAQGMTHSEMKSYSLPYMVNMFSGCVTNEYT